MRKIHANRTYRKAFGQNISRKKSQKQLGHPLTLQACLHGEHPCLMHLVEREKKRSRPIQDAQNPNVI